MVTGIFYGVPSLVFLFSGVGLCGALIRIVVLGVGSMGWRMAWTNDVVEECGVGAMLPLSTLLL